MSREIEKGERHGADIERVCIAYVERTRKEHGLSQRAMSRIMNVDHSYVSAILRGRKPFTVRMLARMLHALGRMVTGLECVPREPAPISPDLPNER